jgi:hypothetical protein
MSLSDSIKNDVSAIFLNTEDFAEAIVYYFAVGGSRSINAIVDRNPPAIYDAAGTVVMPSFIVTIDNDCTTGVTRGEMNTGGDEIELLAEYGDVQRTRLTVMMEVGRDFGGTIQLALK